MNVPKASKWCSCCSQLINLLEFVVWQLNSPTVSFQCMCILMCCVEIYCLVRFNKPKRLKLLLVHRLIMFCTSYTLMLVLTYEFIVLVLCLVCSKHSSLSYVSLSSLAAATTTTANHIIQLHLWPLCALYSILFNSLAMVNYFTYLVLFTIHKAQINYKFDVDECIFTVQHVRKNVLNRHLGYVFRSFSFLCALRWAVLALVFFFQSLSLIPNFQLTPNMAFKKKVSNNLN